MHAWRGVQCLCHLTCPVHNQILHDCTVDKPDIEATILFVSYLQTSRYFFPTLLDLHVYKSALHIRTNLQILHIHTQQLPATSKAALTLIRSTEVFVWFTLLILHAVSSVSDSLAPGGSGGDGVWTSWRTAVFWWGSQSSHLPDTLPATLPPVADRSTLCVRV